MMTLHEPNLQYILYVSKSTDAPSKQLDLEVMTAAYRNNLKTGITGFLRREGGYFFQYFEGPSFAVKDLYEILLCDDRHYDLKILAKGVTTERSFQDWKMGYSDDTEAMFPTAYQMTMPNEVDHQSVIQRMHALSKIQITQMRSLGVRTEVEFFKQRHFAH